jgi:hypothetical protein
MVNETATQQPRRERKRSSRYKRKAPDQLPPFRPGPRDVDILRYVYEYRFLSTPHLVALTDGDKTSVEKRLYKLWQHGYLERRWDRDLTGKAQGPAVYQLDKVGAEALAQVSGIDPGDLDWRVDRDKLTQYHFQHACMVAHIRTVFTLAVRARPEVKLLFWRHDKETQDSVPLAEDDAVYKGAKRETLPIVPDSYFGLSWSDPNGIATGYCMLEADRSTMAQKDFLNKLRAYWLWWRAGKHKEKFGINRFIVLTIALTSERAQNLFELSKRADDRGTGSSMFWFTTLHQLTKPSETTYWSLEEPERVLGKIWMTWEKGQPVRVALVQ